MYIQQFFVKGLAHSSYLLGGSDTCAIIDPRRDIDIYLQAAEDMNLRITHILQTHLHADFVSGHVDLAAATGAPIYSPGDCAFPHETPSAGQQIVLENLRLQVLETPGHSPEHVCYIVADTARAEQPVAVFTGDTLFVGDVGRPDLFPGQGEELAGNLYDSLHSKLLALPDFCEIYPAHGAGSLCGRSMSAKRSSTIGYERRYNRPLQISDRTEFITSLITNMPPVPDHFTRCSAINAAGPTPVSQLPAVQPLTPGAFRSCMSEPNTIVLDTRPYEMFGGQHVPGSYNIDLRGNFATFSGWLLPPDQRILLVTMTPEEAQEAVVLLRTVGLDGAVGYLKGGTFAWAKEGMVTAHVPQVSVHELQALDREVVLVDVRTPSEFRKHHIATAVNIPLPDLRTRYKELDPGAPTLTICSTGHRSSMAASLLKQRGFSHVSNVAGGMTAYAAAGYGPACPMCVIPHGSRFLGQEVLTD
jgi:glyoxylase-like metal-dependent hydrolase (beta-lactamase superfamily II)/rhodanese-related sulfurtransferase